MIGVMFAILLQATVAVTAVAQGSDSRIGAPREVVMRTDAEWQALWNEHSAKAAPVVDFSRSIVVGVFLGTRPTAGYSVDIVAVKVEGAQAVVEYRERAPAPGALAAQMLTSPFHLVSLPLDAGVIRFRKADPPAR